MADPDNNLASDPMLHLANEDKFSELLNGYILFTTDQYEKGASLLREATASTHPEVKTLSHWFLASSLEGLGEYDEARSQFSLAIDSEYQEHSRAAAGDLGLMLQDLGDPDGAAAAFYQAAQGRDAVAAKAALNLGALVAQGGHGDMSSAKQWFEYAVQIGEGKGAARAGWNLATITYNEGDRVQAESWCRRITDFDDPDAGPAGLLLGRLLHDRGDEGEAEIAWRRVVDGQFGDTSLEAGVKLGALLATKGRFSEARSVLEWVQASGHPQHAPAVQRLLATVGD